MRRPEICRRPKSSSIDLPRGIRELHQSRSLISKTVAQSLFQDCSLGLESFSRRNLYRDVPEVC